jgi:Arc/MetJ family transcription regulator
MRTTLDLDDALVTRAKFLTGQNDMAALVHEALTKLVERESARRLAQLGGTEPKLRRTPRRRPHPPIYWLKRRA